MKIYKNYIAEKRNSDIREGNVGPDEKQYTDTVEIIPFVPERFEDDVSRLKSRVGEENFCRGILIEASLAELYEICPHARMRADTYAPLIRFLQEELEITLKISSKRYGSVKNAAW